MGTDQQGRSGIHEHIPDPGAAVELSGVTSVRLGGTELTGLSRRRLTVLRRRRVGFVFQSLDLVPALPVAGTSALPLRLDHRHVDRRQVRVMAERVGIAGLLRRLPDALSGGQHVLHDPPGRATGAPSRGGAS